MKPLIKLYISIYHSEYNQLINDYEKSIDISRKKMETHDKLTKLINEKYIKLQYKSNSLNYEEIKNILGENKNENFDSAVMQLTKNDNKKIRIEKIENFSILQAYKRFTYYLRDISVKHEIIEQEPTTVKDEIIIEDKKTQNEFTTARQVLCAYYILVSLDIEMAYINKTDIAKLVHLFSGSSIPLDENGNEEMDNSLIYKKVKKIFTKGNKKTIQDLEFILKYFEKIDTTNSNGIKKIIKLIKGDINSYK
jgi:hypothetical protein